MVERNTETVEPSSIGTSPSVVVPIAIGRCIGGRFEILEVLGTGGSAVVYRARDLVLAREVALKVLRSDRATPEALTRLRREVGIAQRVYSPNLVRIFDIGESDHGPFITMELVRGESLRKRLARGPLSIDEVITVARGVFAALKTLHDAGIIHRDVTPGNVLLDETGGVKLADFGLARDFSLGEPRATRTDVVVGTAEYLAPEQILGNAPDRRSDLYSAGVLLYEAITGDLPFHGRSSLAMILERVRDSPPELRRACADAPVWLDRIVERLLERHPNRRPAAE